MYKSKEIRWFFKEKKNGIVNWFSDRGVEFSNIKPRTDFYLQIPDREDISVKLREGKIEVKQRTGQPELYELTNNAKGYLEDWVKWSFDIDDKDPLVKSIINEKKYNWVEIYKARLGLKIVLNKDDRMEIHDVKEVLPAGLQVEYTKLKIKGEEWFTFAAEWFGESALELSKDLVYQILNGITFKESDSFGYNQFINSLIY